MLFMIAALGGVGLAIVATRGADMLKRLFIRLAIAASLVFTGAMTAHAADAAPEAGKGMVSVHDGKAAEPMRAPPQTFDALSKESAICASCHAKEHPGLYQQWGQSKHYGANVGCYECHKANPGDPGAIRHKDALITVIVSPKRCGSCHSREVEQFDKSYHSTAAMILGSLDNVLAEVVEGSIHGTQALNGESAVTVQGCGQCHGVVVKVLPDGSLDPATWPNTGIGRINPDGSKGSCTACHQRHSFSAAQARQPETCGKCHLGPDHPQKEIYEESKHGIAYRANIDKMNLNSSKWIPGQDYTAAPTCATCHMSATSQMAVTHDVGARISWNLRYPVSEKIDARAIKAGKQVKSWQDRRTDMKQVCVACHGNNWTNNWYAQFDAVVTTYDEKFGKPGAAIIKSLREANLITKTEFDEKIEWTWFRLWHHEGRRARHGAAMQAPDYVQWHGMFEVAEKFYSELIPEAREIAEKAAANGKKAEAASVEQVINDILDRPEHMWFNGKVAPGKAEHDQKRIDFFKAYNTPVGK